MGEERLDPAQVRPVVGDPVVVEDGVELAFECLQPGVLPVALAPSRGLRRRDQQHCPEYQQTDHRVVHPAQRTETLRGATGPGRPGRARGVTVTRGSAGRAGGGVAAAARSATTIMLLDTRGLIAVASPRVTR
ncbi:MULTISPECIES: hypothetical protein [Pseudonocardia]|uniref:Uncharacterized protein n=1 Tax=Pseudonocardia saturnea TaxID=33909 RepID=A0ABQ0RWQ5_9PSEU|nr:MULTISPECIES: hypothetical protein [Pseudonocardia]BBG03508.1 hypothetical protein Pdca_47170 [Pseudonocardia autotrophica]GEC24928.1 hypothetical protein PSA01_19570 [Pseudonocardia saturnea]